MEPTLLATAIAQYFFIKASDGAIQKLGEDFTTNLYRLKGIIQDLFQNHARNREVFQNPQILEAEILDEFSTNSNSPLKEQLEDIVKRLREIEQRAETININASQNTKLGNSQVVGSAKDSNVIGGNQENYFRQ